MPTFHVTCNPSFSKKSCLNIFSGFALLSTWSLTTEFHPFMLSISGVAREQVWYKRPPFYNSNFSIPNGSASPFGEAQLERFRTPQQWHLALAEIHSTLPGTTTQTSLKLRPKDSRTKQCRLKPAVSNLQATEKREDYSDAAGATGSNHIPVAALFFCGQRSGFFALGWVQSFPTKESRWLKGFCVYYLESH